MKRLLFAIFACITTASACYAQSTTNYYNQYGRSTGSSTTRSNIGGGTTTTYYDQYGRVTGSSQRR